MSFKSLRPLIPWCNPSMMVQANPELSKPILLTKNGRENYNTVCGGLVTIFIFCAMVTYLVILIKIPFIHETVTTDVTNQTGTFVCDNSTQGTPTNTSTEGDTPAPSFTYVCSTSTI